MIDRNRLKIVLQELYTGPEHFPRNIVVSRSFPAVYVILVQLLSLLDYFTIQ